MNEAVGGFVEKKKNSFDNPFPNEVIDVTQVWRSAVGEKFKNTYLNSESKCK